MISGPGSGPTVNFLFQYFFTFDVICVCCRDRREPALHYPVLLTVMTSMIGRQSLNLLATDVLPAQFWFVTIYSSIYNVVFNYLSQKGHVFMAVCTRL